MHTERLSIDQLKLYLYTSFKYITPQQMARLQDKGNKVLQYREHLFELLQNHIMEKERESRVSKVRFFNRVLIMYYNYQTEYIDDKLDKKQQSIKKKKKISRKKSFLNKRIKSIFNMITYRNSRLRTLQREKQINRAFHNELRKWFNLKINKTSLFFLTNDIPIKNNFVKV